MKLLSIIVGSFLTMNMCFSDVIKYEKWLTPQTYSTFIGDTIYDNYFIEAANTYNVDVNVLKAIAKTESGFNPRAVNTKNKNGSIDRGIMQVNSIHLNENLTAEDLFNPRVNIMMGAKVYKMCLDKHKDRLKALNCYNGKLNNNPYGNKVLANLTISPKVFMVKM